MTDADHFRFVDFTEHPLVLLVDTDGNAELHGDDQMCKIQTAAILSTIARDLLAEHGPGRCRPSPDVPTWERPDEALAPYFGTLDRDAQLWTDGTGHVWNLALPWQDNAGSTWLWYGRLDGQGAPLMRSNDWPEPQPLDALRFLRGPMSPVRRGGAA
ncbi:phiSA1p31-related protein [Streptomyces mirabilis]|uniref:phiSA1p31-related protein n=1 Tax=Streptomyces mirabilis TaxID=68239 RepID=UPI0022593B3D|nr:phiSA1p31-related protein [Streptomyces mirabilis]MCX4615742.1 phiSA1p31-related protein [Streptomyces mirabilis]